MDPITTPLLVLVLGNLARELIADASKDYLKDKLKSVFGWLEKLGERDKVELAYQAPWSKPTTRAWRCCCSISRAWATAMRN